MKEYGPIINLWEGSNQGEGYLRYDEPVIVNIHSKSWQVNAILKLQNKNSLDAIINYYMHNGYIDENFKNYYVSIKSDRVPKIYVTYKTNNEFFTLLRINLALSCVKTYFNRYYGVVRVKRDKN